MFFSKISATLCGFAAVSTAHMIMSSPKPFGTPDQAPLLENGSNFPCQMPDYDSTSASVMPKGSQQELAFIGQAVHGGGSCQISITYDTHPTKDSVWKVIHSIQGGCPAKNEAGNMGNSASAADPYTYSFTIPEDIPTGKATLAWTWLNRIGNREYYMNCAPISITGEDGDQSNYEALPDMLVANIAALTTCTTDGLEPHDYLFPNPGKSVENFNMTELVSLKGNCGPVAAVGGGSGSGPSTSAPVASVAPTSTSTANAGVPPTTLAGGVFITVKPSSAASSPATAQPITEAASTTTAAQVAPTISTKAPATTASVAPTTLATSAAPAATTGASSGSAGSSSGSSSGATAAGSACSTDGQWNCVDGTSFQRCASGTWSAVMALAPGMSCTPGQSATLNMKATNGKMHRRLTRFRA